MSDSDLRPVAVFGGMLLVASLIAIGLLWAPNASRSGSNGELIYFTASNERGERITYRGGTDFIGPNMMMNTRLSCASCHGQDAQGGVHMMHMQVMDAPDIRWSTLAGEAGEEKDSEDEHADEHTESHAGYGLGDFRLAVVEGKHPNGEPLSSEMPRWNISNSDLEDLAEFLISPSRSEKGEDRMPGDFMSGGVWIIFPIIGLIIMMMFMLMMFGRGGGFFSRREEPRSRSHRSEIQETETPLSILKSRYARGDISKEQFEEMKKDL